MRELIDDEIFHESGHSLSRPDVVSEIGKRVKSQSNQTEFNSIHF